SRRASFCPASGSRASCRPAGARRVWCSRPSASETSSKVQCSRDKMRRLGSLLLTLLVNPAVARAPTPEHKPPLAGIWTGTLDAGAPLRIILRVRENEAGVLVATLESPDQSPQQVAFDSVEFDPRTRKVHFGLRLIDGVFDGALDAQAASLEGKWTQNG